MKRAVVLAVAILAAGCADKTGILVEVTSEDLSVPDDIDALRFEVTSTGGHTLDQTFDLDGDWPHSLTILPANAEDGAAVITVTGLRGGAFQVRRVITEPFEQGVTRRVTIELSRACVGRMCAAGVDCVNGMCVGDPLVDGGMPVDAGPRDAGPLVDAGPRFDAGPRLDAGPLFDAGPLRDAGPVDAGPFDAGPPIDAGPPPVVGLIFSEYVEGTSNNKALELYNSGMTPIDLSTCVVGRFANGATSPTNISLTSAGTLNPGEVYVICNSLLVGAATICDFQSASVSHNGDDAYDLRCGGTLMDTFGLIGMDPGASWSGGGITTEDHVLTRRCSITRGDLVGDDLFDPSVQYEGTVYVDGAGLAGLGTRSECP